MIKIRLTTWQRIQMMNMLLGQPAGNTFQEGCHGDDFFKAMELTDEEKSEIGFESLGSGGRWDEKKDHVWDISLDEEVWRFVFGRLLHPQAVGWAYDRERNEDMKAKMEEFMAS